MAASGARMTARAVLPANCASFTVEGDLGYITAGAVTAIAAGLRGLVGVIWQIVVEWKLETCRILRWDSAYLIQECSCIGRVKAPRSYAAH